MNFKKTHSYISALALYLLLNSCNAKKSSGEDTVSPASGASNQDLIELQTKGPQEIPGLIGAFGITDDGTASATVSFFSGNRYLSGVIQKVSTQQYRIHANVGYYQQNGTQITFQKRRTTCPVRVQNQATVTGLPTAESVTLTTATRSVILAKFNLATHPTSGPLVIEWGCFLNDNGGLIPFTARGWTDAN